MVPLGYYDRAGTAEAARAGPADGGMEDGHRKYAVSNMKYNVRKDGGLAWRRGSL